VHRAQPIHIDTRSDLKKIAAMFLKRCKAVELVAATIVSAISVATSWAASQTLSDSKDSPSVEIVPQSPTVEIVRESRGLVTSEGPSGMFINPTTATLPQGTLAFAYCSVLTAQDTDVLGNHMFISYGVRDWLEVGVVASMINVTVPGQEFPEGD
jgi:hypothetical protein